MFKGKRRRGTTTDALKQFMLLQEDFEKPGPFGIGLCLTCDNCRGPGFASQARYLSRPNRHLAISTHHRRKHHLEETNKFRISLGLKPLADDKAPADNEEKQAEDNYAKKRGAEKAKESKYVLCCYSYASN